MMEDTFRNALIIISAIVIAAIFIHGLWTIRKNKNPYKLKATTKPVEPLNREFDTKGFDQDGVSKVKVVQTALTGEIEHPPADEEIPHQPAPAPSFDAEPIPKDVEEVESPIQAIEPVVDDLPEIKLELEQQVLEQEPQLEETEHEMSESLEEKSIEPEIKSVYDEPVIQAKPKKDIDASNSKRAAKKSNKKTELKRNQFELNFGDELGDDLGDELDEGFEPKISTDQAPAKDNAAGKQSVDIETEVIVISVVMPEGQAMTGAALLPSLLTLGMKYGDMNIFHRHQDNAGNGSVTFSLANMMNPGTFNLDNIENFATQGISLFMTLPNAADPFAVFEQMLASAKQLGQEFNAQLLDDKRSVLTKQTEQHYVSKIREFERKKRIANA